MAAGDSIEIAGKIKISVDKAGGTSRVTNHVVLVPALAVETSVDIEINIDPVDEESTVRAIPNFDPGEGNETLGWCSYLKAPDTVVLRVFNWLKTVPE